MGPVSQSRSPRRNQLRLSDNLPRFFRAPRVRIDAAANLSFALFIAVPLSLCQRVRLLWPLGQPSYSGRHQLHRPVSCDLSQVRRNSDQRELERRFRFPAQMVLPPSLVLLIVAVHRLDDPLTLHVGFPPVITAKLLSHPLTKRFAAVNSDRSLFAFRALLPPRTALTLLAFVDAHRVALAKAAHGFQFHRFSFGAKHFAVFLFKVAAVVLSPARSPLFRYLKAPIRQVVLLLTFALCLFQSLIVAKAGICQHVFVSLPAVLLGSVNQRKEIFRLVRLIRGADRHYHTHLAIHRALVVVARQASSIFMLHHLGLRISHVHRGLFILHALQHRLERK